MSSSKLVFEGYRDHNYALFVWNSHTNAYEPVSLTGAGSNYLQNYGEQGVVGQGTQGETYISGPDLLDYNGDVYLKANATNGYFGLFVYDTSNDTSSRIQINSGQSQNQASDLVSYGGQIYFDNYAVPPRALSGAVGALYEVVHEVSPSGTTLVANEVSGAPANPSSMVVFDGELFMDGQDSNNNYDLFSYNGSSFTKISAATGLNPTDLTVAGNDLVFNGLDSSGKNALYAYYKSANGSYVLEKVDSGSSSYRDAQGNRGRDPLDITYSGLGYKSQSVVYYSGVTDRHGDRGLFFANVGHYTSDSQLTPSSGKAPANLDPYDLILDSRGDLFFTGNDGLGGRGLFEVYAGSDSYHEILTSDTYNFGNTGAPYNDNWGNLNPNTVTYIAGSSDNGTLYFAANGPGNHNTTQLWEGSVSASGVLSNIHEAPGGSSTGGLNPFLLTH